MKIQLSGVINDSIVDGPGIRFTIFTQGCLHNCPGCHNPSTHDPTGGYTADIDALFEQIQKNKLLKGVTFSGGEPFLQAEALAKLGVKAHAISLNVVTYTGYTFDYLLANREQHSGWQELLEQTDILIDGPFLLEQKSLLLSFRGSANQRVLDCKASLRDGTAVEMEQYK